MDIKILGPGCYSCKELEKVARQAVAETGLEATVEKVEDIMKLLSYRVMHTPALVIDGKVVWSGQIPTVDQVKEYLIKSQ